MPTLPVDHVSAAFDLLAEKQVDMVLGPSFDGGYHLIGWKRPYPALVRDVEMSTPTVVADTLELADAAGVEVALGPCWYDVDRPEDLDHLAADRAAMGLHTRRFFEEAAWS